ncbi:MAG: glycosyltransferase family 2 protein [Nocardioides sp.]|uniref:glycosyltransferase family 2 protein n=1 Tax=Nocardioides sp. TaxID=35761 RepID=UPI003F0EABAF
MLFTVSTVKDSLDNVRFFVEANLSSGVDHMFVFLDAPALPDQREVFRFLREHPDVSVIRTGHDWWGGRRPARLNVRQRINANWVRALLEPFEWAEWLFHVDGDEVVQVDAEQLAAAPAEAHTVWLQPWEAVSRLEPEGRPTQFKRLLDEEELNLLQVLGTLEHPSNQQYFHGHVMGKVGVRPASGVALALHTSIAPGRHHVSRHKGENLAVLHYDAVSGREFVRKWEALGTAGPLRFRPSRMPSARALTHLINSELDPAVRAEYLERIYELTVADDVQTLSDLGLLVDVDPLAGTHRPRPFPPGAREALTARRAEMFVAEKRAFYVPDPKVSFADRARRKAARVLRRGNGVVEDVDPSGDGDLSTED